MRRLSTRCNTRMSTQLRWLLVTRYQPSGRRPSRPLTCHCERFTAISQKLLTLIHNCGMKLSTRSVARRTGQKAAGLMSAKGVIEAQNSRCSAPE